MPGGDLRRCDERHSSRLLKNLVLERFLRLRVEEAKLWVAIRAA
jgi:hypothetical protein